MHLKSCGNELALKFWMKFLSKALNVLWCRNGKSLWGHENQVAKAELRMLGYSVMSPLLGTWLLQKWTAQLGNQRGKAALDVISKDFKLLIHFSK